MQIVIGHVLDGVIIKTDAKMNGIQTIEMLIVVFILIKPYLSNTVYWTAPAKQSDFNKNKEALSHKNFREIDTKKWILASSHETSSRNT